jgi:hypothetical protein
MTKDNSTGKNKDFYDLGKRMFDRIQVLPEHQAMIQRGVDRVTPPKRKPLTNGEIYTAYITATNQTLRPQDERLALAFARAIEAAHGIKETEK